MTFSAFDDDTIKRVLEDWAAQDAPSEELYLESFEHSGRLIDYCMAAAAAIAEDLAESEEEYEQYAIRFLAICHLFLQCIWYQLGGRLPVIDDDISNALLPDHENTFCGTVEEGWCAQCVANGTEGIAWLIRMDTKGMLMQDMFEVLIFIPNARGALLVFGLIAELLRRSLEREPSE
jgi:hypothetical protein